MAAATDKSQELETVTSRFRKHLSKVAKRQTLQIREGRLREATADLKAQNDRLEKRLKGG